MNYPLKYLPWRLSTKDRKRQLRQLKISRDAYKKNIYITRSKVKSYTSKKSQHLSSIIWLTLFSNSFFKSSK